MTSGLGFGFAMFKGLRVDLRVFAEELYVFQMRWRSDVRLRSGVFRLPVLRQPF